MGIPASHVSGFKQGGLQRLLDTFDRNFLEVGGLRHGCNSPTVCPKEVLPAGEGNKDTAEFQELGPSERSKIMAMLDWLVYTYILKLWPC